MLMYVKVLRMLSTNPAYLKGLTKLLHWHYYTVWKTLFLMVELVKILNSVTESFLIELTVLN